MKKIKSERGQSLVELAISIVLLLVLLSGAVEFGIAFFQFVQLRDAAQEGALYGSMNPYKDTNGNGQFDSSEVGTVNQAAIEARVRAASNSPINLADTSTVSVVASSSDGSNKFCEGYGLKVTVTFQHKVFMPFLSGIIGNTIPLNAEVIDTILSPVCP